ncbi:MAG: MerR family DNA-binding transcriptional regulator [Deltaproteobacteria bacterium]|nr:MerR family DNA-binding transcriptional regulator [Deltaproteobacteria bacterium]
MQIQVGPVYMVLEGEEELQAALRTLFRHLSNKELAEMVGVSERTVRRWKDEGLLPDRGRERVMILDLLESAVPEPDAPPALSCLANSGWSLVGGVPLAGGSHIEE